MTFFRTTAVLALLCGAPLAAAAQITNVYAAWSQINGTAPGAAYDPAAGFADLNINMRLILEGAGAQCPDFAAIADTGTTQTLHSLSWSRRDNNPDTSIFDLIVCETPMPAHWDSATLVQSAANPVAVTLTGGDGAAIVLPGAARVGASGPPEFVAIGDTGCRGAQNPRGSQVCDRPPQGQETGFFFEKLMAQATALSPDFILHLGDYRYDKEAQYTGHQSWDMWQSDFFQRVRLGPLTQAPWAMVRGNHEECDLAGQGWFLFFGPPVPAGNCASTSDSSIAPTWYFDVVDRTQPTASPHRFVVLDTSQTVHRQSAAWDRAVAEMAIAVEAAQTPGWSGSARASAWLVMHKPVWAADDFHNPPEQADYHTGAALAEAMGQRGTPACTSYDAATCGVRAVLAAHLHIVQTMVASGATLPQQYVVGNSGVRLDHAVHPSGCTMALNPQGFGGQQVQGQVAYVRARVPGGTGNGDFGFSLFRRGPDSSQSGWTATAYFVDGSTAPLPGPASAPGPACQH